jgi:hypothetical protein
MPCQFRLVASAAAPAATFFAVSRLIGSPYGMVGIASGTVSFGLFGSGGTCAKAPEQSRIAAHATIVVTLTLRIKLPPLIMPTDNRLSSTGISQINPKLTKR